MEAKKIMRIMIFGKPGSGKTTFALPLSKKLNIPLYHIDKFFYTNNWVERDYKEFLQIQHDLVNQENWIIDGNATSSFEMRYQRADIALYFCPPTYKALWGIIKRKYFSQKNAEIDDRAPECPETIRWSLLRYLFTYEERVKEKLGTLRTKYPQVKFYTIKNRDDLKHLESFIIK